MLRIGNKVISPFLIKIFLFIILLPTLYLVWNLSTWEFTREDFQESLTSAQKSYYEVGRHYNNDFENNYQEEVKSKRYWDEIRYKFIVICYIPIALALILVTDRKMRSTQAGIFVAQYIKWEFIENLFKPKAREYEIKDLEHEEIVHDFEHKKRMKDLEYLAPLALINFNNAKTDLEKARAAILKDAVNCMYKMSDRWRAYVYSSVMGGAGSPREDADLQDEINRIKLEIELEALRTKKMENDERQRKHDANKRPPPDV